MEMCQYYILAVLYVVQKLSMRIAYAVNKFGGFEDSTVEEIFVS
jgi:hypothetical protein